MMSPQNYQGQNQQQILPLAQHRPAGRQGPIAALDVGSTKVTCFIAQPVSGKGDLPGKQVGAAASRLRIIGIGHHACQGLKAGTVINLDQTETAIRQAVEAAERMAGETIGRVSVSFAGRSLRSDRIGLEVELGGAAVSGADMESVLQAARDHAASTPGRALIQAAPTGYTLDGETGFDDPRDLTGNVLGVQMHVMTADWAPLQNLVTAVRRAHLEVDALVAAPHASALATLMDDEKDLGVTLIDIGAGTTSVAVFFDGHLTYACEIPAGAHYVTCDIAHGLNTNIAAAERLKTLHGSAIGGTDDPRAQIDVPRIGEDDLSEPMTIPKSMLTGFIQPRIEQILGFVQKKLDQSGMADIAGRRVVITGGGANLTGIGDLAGRVLGSNVRIGRPFHVQGLAESMSGPGFATPVGLLLHAIDPKIDHLTGSQASLYGAWDGQAAQGTGGFFRKLGNWFRAA